MCVANQKFSEAYNIIAILLASDLYLISTQLSFAAKIPQYIQHLSNLTTHNIDGQVHTLHIFLVVYRYSYTNIKFPKILSSGTLYMNITIWRRWWAVGLDIMRVQSRSLGVVTNPFALRNNIILNFDIWLVGFFVSALDVCQKQIISSCFHKIYYSFEYEMVERQLYNCLCVQECLVICAIIKKHRGK